MPTCRKSLLSTSILLAGLQIGQASAQRLEEVVITAQKRDESINEVGLTVQAISGDQLASQGITSIREMVKVVPSLTYANSYYNTPVYTLRELASMKIHWQPTRRSASTWTRFRWFFRCFPATPASMSSASKC